MCDYGASLWVTVCLLFFCNDESSCVVASRHMLCCVMVGHRLSWCVTVICGASWSVVMCYGESSCHGESSFVIVCLSVVSHVIMCRRGS